MHTRKQPDDVNHTRRQPDVSSTHTHRFLQVRAYEGWFSSRSPDRDVLRKCRCQWSLEAAEEVANTAVWHEWERPPREDAV